MQPATSVVSVDAGGQHPKVLKFAATASGDVAPLQLHFECRTATDHGANIAIF